MLQEKALQRASSGTGAVIDFTGTWTNEIKSIMTIIQNGDILAGEYESAVSDTHSSTKGKLQGFVDGDLISFVVHWNDFQAITAWVGQIVPKTSERQLATLWQMTRQVKEGEEWASINAGADKFTRQKKIS